ncbi:MAG: AbrB/MazE/SpoVT family DNA-binding domain-containing protein [Nitrospirae bacterium]|nr:AbrB/MazE/SpoVT family DNA-binding domain-containing protein [Nitrospirota bacterium]
MLAKVTPKGQISIPTEVRKASGIELGDYVELEVKDGKVVLTPKLLIDKEQAWFWSKEWQEKERRAESDRKAGRSRTFKDAGEALEWLKS